MDKTPKELFQEKRGITVVKNLENRHFEAYYCPTEEEALQKVLELIPEESSVSWGGSMTIRDMGLTDALNRGNYRTIDRDKAENEEEKKKAYRDAMSAEYYLTSANGISEDGQLVNVDGTGNRVAAIVYGPEYVIVVAGMNKVAKTADDALVRARTIAAPTNQQRFQRKTPCTVTGACGDCISPDCICNQVLITRNCSPAGRIKVVLVGEELGY
ncbi:lactate utilization protein [Qiania dongpingensis]|uniref:Lactate utilization protein n=1 Tax=Qiania dongpingensis TaxID=2763669 RepID=A0A7G9G4J3_9FIRM|nr:lactate utilization protein [Qiania dongpingensis]QNM05725.1 lactate utilization protein [Qiania dongpingensis]